MKRRPRVLVCAGWEPSGRVGLLADLRAIWDLGGVGVGVVTTLTAQADRAFEARAVPVASVAAQVRAALELGPVDAVKLGAVPSRRHLGAIRRALSGLDVWWVIDPVTRTSRGQRLSTLKPQDYRALSGPKRALTPNQAEARALGDLSAFAAVVTKGGASARDVLTTPQGTWALTAARLHAKGRGTGCRFASAWAVTVARGASPLSATRAAKRYVRRYLRSLRSKS